MEIHLKSVGKKFRKSWVFRDLSHTINGGQKLAILGQNGSGKSTLLQILSGAVLPSSGELTYSLNGEQIAPEKVYNHISFASPYTQLYEQLTLEEMLEIHRSFKSLRGDMSNEKFIELTYLEDHKYQAIENFSSGMKQRLKLALAICSDSDLLLLDEPTTNLDERGIDWYKKLVEEYDGNRTIVVCSNKKEEEYGFCTSEIDLS